MADMIPNPHSEGPSGGWGSLKSIERIYGTERPPLMKPQSAPVRRPSAKATSGGKPQPVHSPQRGLPIHRT